MVFISVSNIRVNQNGYCDRLKCFINYDDILHWQIISNRNITQDIIDIIGTRYNFYASTIYLAIAISVIDLYTFIRRLLKTIKNNIE